jgi:hypothetical protein
MVRLWEAAQDCAMHTTQSLNDVAAGFAAQLIGGIRALKLGIHSDVFVREIPATGWPGSTGRARIRRIRL